MIAAVYLSSTPMSTATRDLAPNLTVVMGLARSWATRHPGLAARIERAIALVSNVQPGDMSADVYFVEGSFGARYMVRVLRAVKTSTCTCRDHENGNHCKHRLAAALFEKGREVEVC